MIIIFDSEYRNRERWKGKAKEYSCYGRLIFEGEYLNNHKKRGKEYINNKLIYEGEYLFDKK